MEYRYNYDNIPGFGERHDFAGFYEAMVVAAPANSTLLETGCLNGRSLIQLGLCAEAANKGLRVIGVDHCAGESAGCDIAVLDNITKAGLTDIITFYKMDAVEAAKLFEDNSIWMVFLDDDHTHERVATEIDVWMPKITTDGWLSGHDGRWHTVWEPVYYKLYRPIHDPTWNDCWRVRKQVPKPHTGPNAVDIYKHIVDAPNFGYGVNGCRNDHGTPGIID